MTWIVPLLLHAWCWMLSDRALAGWPIRESWWHRSSGWKLNVASLLQDEQDTATRIDLLSAPLPSQLPCRCHRHFQRGLPFIFWSHRLRTMSRTGTGQAQVLHWVRQIHTRFLMSPIRSIQTQSVCEGRLRSSSLQRQVKIQYGEVHTSTEKTVKQQEKINKNESQSAHCSYHQDLNPLPFTRTKNRYLKSGYPPASSQFPRTGDCPFCTSCC